MSNQPSYLTKCIDAINELRKDVAEGQIAFYHVDQLPSGTLPSSLADKCSSAVVAVSGNGTSSYVAVLPQRVDVERNTGLKVYDSDPIIFASKAGESETFPTGVFIHHSDYPGRTEPIAGYETCSYQQTINALKSGLITGQQPLSAADPKYTAAISHGIALFDQNLGQQFSNWPPETESGERPDI